MKPVISVRRAWSVFALAVLTTAGVAHAQVVNITYTPTTPFAFDENNVTGVFGDGAPGFDSGSFASDGSGKTDIHIYAQVLFPEWTTVTLGDIASMSFWTKKGTTHAVNLVDWALTLYTQPYAGDLSTPATWYGDRIGAEPYFAINMNDPANTWNQWSTEAGPNQLRFYESTQGAPGANFGEFDDPTWDSLLGMNAISGQPYANRELLRWTIQTGSATADGFFGQVDGLRIELTDGSVGTVNFEAIPEPGTYAAMMGALVLGVVVVRRYRRRDVPTAA